jgi:restriction system protein
MKISFEGYEESIKEVAENKKYWFVRTFSGEAYREYYKEGFIGLGLNNVPIDYINKAPIDKSSYKTLQTFINNNTSYKKSEATKWANQLIDFNKGMQNGDCVIIPDKNSDRFAIGEIKGDVYRVNNPKTINFRGKVEQLPSKRRKVKWLKEIDKFNFYSDLRAMTSSHQGITNVDAYSEKIEGLLSSLFIKDDRGYLVIQVKKDESINAFDLKEFLDNATYFYQEFSREFGAEYDESVNEDLSIKIQLQSKGKMALSALTIVGLLGIGTIIALSNNSELELDLKSMKLKSKSGDGLTKSITEFLDAKEERRERAIRFDDSIKRLNATRNLDSTNHPTSGNPKSSGK